MSIRRILLLTIVAVLSVGNLYGQTDWKLKAWDQWDKSDVEKILNNSEFAKSQEVRLQYEPTQVVAAGSFTPATLATGNSGGGTTRGTVNTVNQGAIQPTVSFVFTLRMRSSLAIRLAMVRKNQLETDVEKMTKEELELFNKRQIGLYDCPACVNNYVLTLTSSSSENKNFDAVYSAFSNARIDDLKRYIYLVNDKGEKRELVNFVAPKRAGDEAVFFFPRLDAKGAPLFTMDSKYLIFNVTNNDVNAVTNFKVEIPPMIVGDHIEF
ncbi:MAG: hypothetical protein IPN69_09395 [Acidobacteria bacterium]|nr:hypothetical protein [Acidobacteriota bacterium]MBK8150527.1 hypothetical protein [Acidobacteriota bacterium]MBK8810930.1 hypothetical protein [Acidobacteriota bacterium]